MAATCEAPATCRVCEYENGDKLSHNFENGECTECGLVEGTPEVEEVELSLSFDTTANRTTFTTSQQVWTQNGVTLTNNKGSSTSNVADYSKPARFYKSSNILVEVEGKQITKIVFDCNSSSYATALKDSIGTVSGATVSVSSDKVTVTFAEAVDSFTIASLTGGQVRMDSITVTAIG